MLRIEKARLYRGRGGEIVRASVCRLIQCIAEAEFSLEPPVILRLQVRTASCSFSLLIVRLSLWRSCECASACISLLTSFTRRNR